MKNGPYELVIAPPDYPGKKYRGRYCYEHLLVWWRNTGELLDLGEHIHHKDDDKRNNSFANLEKMPRSKHVSLHGKRRGNAMVELICPNCQRIFVRQKRYTHLQKGSKMTFCCRKCVGEYAFSRKKKEGFNTALEAPSSIIREFRS